MKYEGLRVLKYSGKLAGLDGDLYAHYYLEAEVYIGVCPALAVTIQANSLDDLVRTIIGAVKSMLKNVSDSEDLDIWAMERGIEIRDIPNLTMLRTEYRMPNMIFMEADSIDELENLIKGR